MEVKIFPLEFEITSSVILDWQCLLYTTLLFMIVNFWLDDTFCFLVNKYIIAKMSVIVICPIPAESNMYTSL